MSDRVPAPIKAIRTYCLDCTGGNDAETRRCTARQAGKGSIDASACHLWPWRMGTKADKSRSNKVPVKSRAVRLECMNCMGGSSEAVKTCPSAKCALYPHRLGRNPNQAHRKPSLISIEKLKAYRFKPKSRAHTTLNKVVEP